jgi:hypothetical protein
VAFRAESGERGLRPEAGVTQPGDAGVALGVEPLAPNGLPERGKWADREIDVAGLELWQQPLRIHLHRV